MERRRHDRIRLADPMQCLFRIAGGPLVAGTIDNISLRGVLIAAPDLNDDLLIDCCVPVVFDGTGTPSDELLCANEAELTWTYDQSIGVKFTLPLMDSDEDLREWLAQRGFEEATAPETDPFKP